MEESARRLSEKMGGNMAMQRGEGGFTGIAPPTQEPPEMQGNMPDLSGMTQQLTQRPPQGPPQQGMTPNIVNLFKGLAMAGHGKVVDGVPQRPATKSDAFQEFLGNFLTSFSQGMGAAGTGPGANGRGFAAAMAAPYQRDLQQYQLQQQADTQQSQMDERASQSRLRDAQAAALGDQITLPNGMVVPRSLGEKLLLADKNNQAAQTRTETTVGGANERSEADRAIRQQQLDLNRKKEQRLAAGQAENLRLKELGINTANQFRTRIIQENVNGTPHNILINGATGDMIADLGEGKLAAADAQSRGDFQTLSDQFARLSLLANSNPDAIGPLEGRMGQLRAQFIGGDPDAADLYSTAHDLQNQIIYLRSGKQINEAEFARLMKALPDPNLPLDTFKTRLANFRTQMAAVYRNRTGKNLGESTPASGRRVIDLTK